MREEYKNQEVKIQGAQRIHGERERKCKYVLKGSRDGR